MDAGLAAMGATSPSNIARLYSQPRPRPHSTPRQSLSPLLQPIYCSSNPPSYVPPQLPLRQERNYLPTPRESASPYDKTAPRKSSKPAWHQVTSVPVIDTTNVDLSTLDPETLQSLRRASLLEHRQKILESNSRELAKQLAASRRPSRPFTSGYRYSPTYTWPEARTSKAPRNDDDTVLLR